MGSDLPDRSPILPGRKNRWEQRVLTSASVTVFVMIKRKGSKMITKKSTKAELAKKAAAVKAHLAKVALAHAAVLEVAELVRVQHQQAEEAAAELEAGIIQEDEEIPVEIVQPLSRWQRFWGVVQVQEGKEEKKDDNANCLESLR